MPQSTAPTRWTAEMVRALPDDGNRYEVVDGELLVTPSPTWDHQRVVREVLLVLHQYVRSSGIGEVMLSPSDVELDARSLVQPDLFVVDLDARVIERWRSGDDRPEVLGETVTWLAPGAAAPLTIDLAPLFARIHGEIL